MLGFIALDILFSMHVSTEKGGAHTFKNTYRSISASFVQPSQPNVHAYTALMHGMHMQQEY
jgi:hypothetical protein